MRNNDGTDAYVEYTKNAVFPLKMADLLDERLDEIELQLKHIPVEYIQPLTIVTLILTNTPKARFSSAYYNQVVARSENPDVIITYDATTKRITETLRRDFIVASDNSSEVIGLKIKHGANAGKKTYDHNLYLIELTKIAEGFIGDPISFTNTLGNDFISSGGVGYVSINRTGQSSISGDYISQSWSMNAPIVQLPYGTRLYYNGDNATVLRFDESNDNISIRFYKNGAFNSVAQGGTIKVQYFLPNIKTETVTIIRNGQMVEQDGYITQLWFCETEMPRGAILTYNYDTAEVINYNAFNRSVGLRFAASGAFASVPQGDTIQAQWRLDT